MKPSESKPVGNDSAARNAYALASLWLLAAGAAAWLGYVAVQRHLNLHAGYDLAVFNQLLWNSMHGRIWENSSPWLQPYFATHFTPFLLALVPVYALCPGPIWLMLIQVLAVVGTGLILAFTCKHLGLNLWVGVALAFAYFLHPSIQGLALDDFHIVSFGPLFLAAALWAIAADKPRWTVFLLIILALVREDLSLVATLTAFSWWLQSPRRWKRLTLAAGIGIYGLLVLLVWMPALRPFEAAPFLDRLGIHGGYVDVLKALLNPLRWIEAFQVPARLWTLTSVLMCTALAPLLAPRFWPVVAIPGAIFLLGQDPALYEMYKGIPLHYTSLFAATVFIIAPFGLKQWTRFGPFQKQPEYLITFMLIGSCIVSWQTGYLGVRDFWSPDIRYQWTFSSPHRAEARRIARSLAPELRLVPSHRLMSLVACRRGLLIPEIIPDLKPDDLPVFLFLEKQVLENPQDVEHERFLWALENGICTTIHDQEGVLLIRYDGKH